DFSKWHAFFSDTMIVSSCGPFFQSKSEQTGSIKPMNCWPAVEPFTQVCRNSLFTRYIDENRYNHHRLTHFPFVALRINSATSFGCDMYDTWLAGSDIVVAFICFANIRSISGGIDLSLSET